jgi:acyl-CoA synthetase (AMP-forming)/AMP-acid ligase II
MNQTPWLGHYDPGVPATLAPYPSRTLLDYVADAARTLPNHPALLFKGSTLTYGALERLSDACASALSALGVARGDRVALLLPNCPQFFIVELGAWKLGATSPRSTPSTPTRKSRRLREGSDDHRHVDAVLRPREARSSANGAPPGDRHQHQGVLPRAAADAVHVVS